MIQKKKVRDTGLLRLLHEGNSATWRLHECNSAHENSLMAVARMQLGHTKTKYIVYVYIESGT